MNNEKIVVVLLIITIVLSAVSIMFALSGGDSVDVPQRNTLDHPDASSSVSFGLEERPLNLILGVIG